MKKVYILLFLFLNFNITKGILLFDSLPSDFIGVSGFNNGDFKLGYDPCGFSWFESALKSSKNIEDLKRSIAGCMNIEPNDVTHVNGLFLDDFLFDELKSINIPHEQIVLKCRQKIGLQANQDIAADQKSIKALHDCVKPQVDICMEQGLAGEASCEGCCGSDHNCKFRCNSVSKINFECGIKGKCISSRDFKDYFYKKIEYGIKIKTHQLYIDTLWKELFKEYDKLLHAKAILKCRNQIGLEANQNIKGDQKFIKALHHCIKPAPCMEQGLAGKASCDGCCGGDKACVERCKKLSLVNKECGRKGNCDKFSELENRIKILNIALKKPSTEDMFIKFANRVFANLQEGLAHPYEKDLANIFAKIIALDILSYLGSTEIGANFVDKDSNMEYLIPREIMINIVARNIHYLSELLKTENADLIMGLVDDKLDEIIPKVRKIDLN